MKIKRKAVSNKAGINIPPQVLDHLDSEAVGGDEVSTSTYVNDLGHTRAAHCHILPVLSTSVQNNLPTSSAFCASAVGSTLVDMSGVQVCQGPPHNFHLPDYNNGPPHLPVSVVSTAVEATIVGFPTHVLSTAACATTAGFPTFCGAVVGSSSTGILTTEVGHDHHGNAVVTGVQSLHSDEGPSLVSTLHCQMEVQHGKPVEVPTVDGSVSTFTSTNIMWPYHAVARQPSIDEVTGDLSGHNPTTYGHAPMVLDFSTGRIIDDLNSNACGFTNLYMHCQPIGHVGVPPVGIPATATSQRGRRRSLRVRQRVLNDQPCLRDPAASPVQGPVAPPQRQGAPLDYRRFGRCDQVCQHCGALFWLEEKRTGLPMSAVPQYQRCCAAGREAVIDGLIHFLDQNNALVRLFRTARDKLREANIPNFTIRLFGVVGVSQYELPTADSIGAIVYEGGASSSTPDIPIVPSRQFAYFTELNPTDNSKYIEVRVYRKWTTVKMPSFTPTSFSCILLDKQGSALQANADLKEKDRFDRDLQINSVYRIQGFGFEKTDNWGKTLDNDFTLCFGKYTQIDLLQDNDFPYHYFNFAAYNELNARLEKKNPILTDYIGYVHNVERVNEYGSATGNRVKVRNIGLRNLNNNVVLFTLWNDDADRFDENEYAQMKQPVILAVSSCYLKRYAGQIQLSATSATRYYFNPDVQQTGELLAAYNAANTATGQLQVQTERLTNWEDERNRNRVPLATLLQIDPKNQQRVLFTQEATILQVDAGHNWYYQKCDECGGKIRYGYLHGQCHQYGSKPNPENSYCFKIVITDGTANATMSCFTPQTDELIKNINALLEEVEDRNPATMPAAILALQHTRHTFQFQFGTPTMKGPPTFVLKKVMDNPPNALPQPSVAPSSPPRAITMTHTDEESSPPPVTPILTQDTPVGTSTTAGRPVESAAKKKLFGESSEKEENPIPIATAVAYTDEQPTPLPATPIISQDIPADTPTTAGPPPKSAGKKDLLGHSSDKQHDPSHKQLDQKTIHLPSPTFSFIELKLAKTYRQRGTADRQPPTQPIDLKDASTTHT
ncbi:nucleic acid-binding, OB-fold protein [Artemisia annua]|uniref:Nucleic acid-binding, OB-fold protein n=1 Tax=Artemisia annua TaxID=35608 RepID=A0A2U1QNZ7_ARTAN|nr:nucleic acid-binding, OB-fold protein [Artemisia annua]